MSSLGRIQATLKTGSERLIYDDKILDFSLLDFWRWSVSDILSNATRGRFAEFIVATAAKIDIKVAIRSFFVLVDLYGIVSIC